MNRFALDPNDGNERRVLPTKFEIRGEGDNPKKVVGYAAVFGKRSENFGSEAYPFYEIIEPGAFRDVLKDDVRAVIDHSGGLQTLARTKSGTLSLFEDEIGLRFEFEAPDTQAGRDIVTILKRGDIDQASFAFTINKDGQEFEEPEENGKEVVIRRIKKVARLYDVSPVTYPAYPDTMVQARSFERFQKERETKTSNQLCASKVNERARKIRLMELEQLQLNQH